MTERLSEIEARIGTVRQLAAVIGAMRGVAAARSREAREGLDGIRAFAQVIAAAIGQALAFLPQAERAGYTRRDSGAEAVVALCAEQGFAGAFSERVLDVAVKPAEAEQRPRQELLLLGDRGLMVAGDRGVVVDWSAPMVAHVAQVAALAGRVADALYERLEDGRIARVRIVHAVPGPSLTVEVVQKTILPFDFDRFPLASKAVAPLLTLPPSVLLARLAEEYVFAELCEAVMLSFAAENEARMRAMMAARTNVANKLDALIARSRQVRQEEITNEIIELAGETLTLSERRGHSSAGHRAAASPNAGSPRQLSQINGEGG
jgi:F-type H+-transporting ATPase subunit gamma